MRIQKRKRYNVRGMLSILYRQITAKKKTWIFCGIVELLAVFLNLNANNRKYIIGYGLKTCKADFFVWENGLYAKLFYILPIMLFLFMKDSKAIEEEQYFIRRNTRREIWNETVLRTAVISLLLSAFHLICIWLYALLNSAEKLNWEQKRSVFWFLTGGKVCSVNSISYEYVLLCFFILEALTCFITGIFYRLCNIWFRNQIFSWFFCMGMVLIDQYIGVPISFYGKLSMDYTNWLYPHLVRSSITAGLTGQLGFVLGKYLMERKEYYGK